MTKLIPILSGRGLVVELPEGANRFTVFNDYRPYLSFFVSTETPRVYLPEGNWRIIGRLSEVREKQAANIVERENFVPRNHGGYRNYAETKYDWFGTALESFHSAIKADGWYLENPYGATAPNGVMEGNFNKYLDWADAQQRVLDPERCLLLGRED